MTKTPEPVKARDGAHAGTGGTKAWECMQCGRRRRTYDVCGGALKRAAADDTLCVTEVEGCTGTGTGYGRSM